MRDGLRVVEPGPEGDEGSPVVPDEGEAVVALAAMVRLAYTPGLSAAGLPLSP